MTTYMNIEQSEVKDSFLKDCRCGGAAEFYGAGRPVALHAQPANWHVLCANCKMMTPPCSKKEEAVTIWNNVMGYCICESQASRISTMAHNGGVNNAIRIVNYHIDDLTVNGQLPTNLKAILTQKLQDALEAYEQ